VLASGSRDAAVRLWDPSTGKERGALAGHKGEVTALAFSPDGKLLASGGDDTVRVWDPAARRAVRTFAFSAVRGVAFSPDGKRLAASAGTWPREVRVWDLTGAEKVALRGRDSSFAGVEFSPGGGMLAAGCGDGSVRLWDARADRERGTLWGHRKMVWAVAFSSDGRLLASGGEGGTVCLWAVPQEGKD
jgi:WD40 repeat protein